MSKKKIKDKNFVFLSANLRAREAKMLSQDRIERMIDATSFEDSAKFIIDCGYNDLSSLNTFNVETALAEHRSEIFEELSNNVDAKPLVDFFRIKYDYHNVKTLVKALDSGTDTSGILSDSGRVSAKALSEAFVSGDRQSLPVALYDALIDCGGILQRTGNPQLSDIAADKAYFNELLSLSKDIGNAFITGYVRLLIDCANLKTFVRAIRIGRDSDFIGEALIPGGNAGIASVAKLPDSGDGIAEVFRDSLLTHACTLASGAVKGGAQTEFELQCDNAVNVYISSTKLVAFGPAIVFSFIAELEWEITAIRMILTGKLNGIAPNTIRERLRECHV